MTRAAWLAAAVCLTLISRQAAAEEQRVVVLMPRAAPTTPWPEGTQAVIAELAASHYQVIVESTSATGLAALMGELRDRAFQAGNAGAISIVRELGAGVAYVWTPLDESVVQVHSDDPQGAVSEGALALRVLELIRARSLPLPESKEEPATPSSPPPPTSNPPPPRESSRSRHGLLWLGAGPTFAAGAPAPLVEAALGGRIALWRRWSLEAGAAISLAPLELDTRAGNVRLSARKFTLHALIEPWRTKLLQVGFGLGGGVVWLSESAQADTGFAGHADNTYLGLISLRASATLQSGDLSFVFAAEPGLLLPGASIRANGETLAHVGRSWTSLTAGIGWAL